MYYLSLALSLLKFEDKRRFDQRVSPHIVGFVHGMRTSCVLLSWLVFYNLYLCSIYSLFYGDVIANMERKLNKFLQHRTYPKLTYTLVNRYVVHIYAGYDTTQH